MLTSLALKAFGALSRLPARTAGERGQDLIEYSMLGGILAASIVGIAYLVLTGSLDSMFSGIGNCIDWNGDSACLP